MTDSIHIEGQRVDCVIGVYPHERKTRQPLVVDVSLKLDLEPAGVDERLSSTVNYAALSEQLRFILENAEFRMLETAAIALLRYLLAPPARGESRAQIKSAEVRLSKPQALGGQGVPSVTMRRGCEWVELGREVKDFGEVDIIHETADAGIYRLCISPGQVIPMHVHHEMHEAEYVLTEGLLCQGEVAEAGSYRLWPLDTAHEYRNETNRWQSILCIDSPPFKQEDERLVDRAAGDIEVHHYSRSGAA